MRLLPSGRFLQASCSNRESMGASSNHALRDLLPMLDESSAGAFGSRPAAKRGSNGSMESGLTPVGAHRQVEAGFGRIMQSSARSLPKYTSTQLSDRIDCHSRMSLAGIQGRSSPI